MKMAELLPLHYTFTSNNETEHTSTLTFNQFLPGSMKSMCTFSGEATLLFSIMPPF